jgi:ATP-binding cassette, subfamily B, bacterial PglK
MQYLKEILYLVGNDRFKLPFLLLLFLIMSLLEVLGISLIVPYVGLIMDPDLIYSEKYSFFVNLFSVFQFQNILVPMGIVLVSVFVIKSLGIILINWIILKFCYSKSVSLKSILMKSYQEMPYVNYIEKNSAEYIYSMGLVDEFSIGTLSSILRMVVEFFVGLSIFVLLFYQSPVALILILLILVISIVFYDVFFKAKVKDYGRMGNLHSVSLIKGVNEGISGLKEIRILGKNNFFFKKVRSSASSFSKVALKYDMISIIPRYLLEVAMISFIVVLVLYQVLLGQEANELLPILAMISIATVRLLPSANQFIIGLTKLRHSRHAISTLYQDIKLSEKFQSADEINYKSKFDDFKKIELQNISFTYATRKQKTISNLSMKIKSGQSIGIIGTSGSGKSTLLDILLGLLDIDSGQILYNDKQTNSSYLTEWRSKVAYLPQKVFIIDETLRNNIALGENNSEIDTFKLNKAIKQSQLNDLIKELPKGVDTILGDKGIQLSGGQLQRIALARAFYFERDVLIMDEATSSLDNETEAEIVNEIKKLKGDKTLIVVAHRFSTLMHCEYIYRLEGGVFIDEGTYDKVIN